MKEDLTGKKIGVWQIIACHDPPINTHGEVEWDCICPTCGRIVQQTYYKLTKHPSKGCYKCKGINAADDLRGKKFGRLTPVEYKGSNNGNGAMWLCQCDCGNTTIVQAGTLKNGKTQSCGCWNREQLCLPNEDLSGKMFGYLKILAYTGKNGNGGSIWKALCTYCGRIIEVSRHDIIATHKISCGCIKSKSEVFITQYLIQNNIPFTKEYCFDDLKSEKGYPLRFDFAIFDKNNKQIKFLLEYQGEQHYYSSDFFGGVDTFISGQTHDNMKRVYCYKHNISLIEIPYYDNLEKRLEEIFYDY